MAHRELTSPRYAELRARYGGVYNFQYVYAEDKHILEEFRHEDRLFRSRQRSLHGYVMPIEEMVGSAHELRPSAQNQLPRLVHVDGTTAIWIVRDGDNLFRVGFTAAMVRADKRWDLNGVGIENDFGDYFIFGTLNDMEMQELHQGVFPRTLRQFGFPGPRFRAGMLGYHFGHRPHPGPSMPREPRAISRGPGTENDSDFGPSHAKPHGRRPRNNTRGKGPQGRPNVHDFDSEEDGNSYDDNDDDDEENYDIDGKSHRRPTRRPQRHSDEEDLKPYSGSNRPHDSTNTPDDTFLPSNHKRGTSATEAGGFTTRGGDRAQHEDADNESDGFDDDILVGKTGATLPPPYKTTVQPNRPAKEAKPKPKEKRTGL